EEAAPRLAGRRVREVRIGAKMLAVALDNGRFGVASALRGERGESPAAVPDVGALVGRPATELAAGLLSGEILDRALGVAVLSAVAEPDPALVLEDADGAAVVATRPTDTVGLVGFMRTLAARLEPQVARLMVFDRSERENVYPEEWQPELLPQCDLVFITATAILNGTLERLLTYCTGAREVVVVGPTTPLYPAAFAGTGVTVLAGAAWPPEHREAVMAAIARGASFHDISSLARRWALRVGTRPHG
ncbi:MAG: DUF364 domain-containing protein, partial [Bacillota bacterium]